MSAGAVYATCHLPGNEADALAAQEQAQFLFLWQKGFTNTKIVCDTTAGQTYGLPLNSFGDVVQADSLVLAMLIVLTALAQILWGWHERERTAAMHRFGDQLRGVLIECAKGLQVVRSAQDTGALVLQASNNLLRVSTDFSRQAREMMANLNSLGSGYSQVAEGAAAATKGLERVLDQVATSADKLAEVSLGVRDDLAKGAAAMESSVKASSDSLGAVGSQLGSVTEAVRELDRNVRLLVHVDESAAAVRNETKTSVNHIAGQINVLANIHLAIVKLGDLFRKDRVQIPVPAWRMYGVLLAAQLLLLLIGVGVLIFRPPLAADANGGPPASPTPVVSPSASRTSPPSPTPSATARP